MRTRSTRKREPSQVDTTTGTVVASCTRWSSCSTWVWNPPGRHVYEAIIGTPAGSNAQASSPAIAVTWVPATVTLSASSSSARAGSRVMLTATVNENVGRTPWVIIITDLTTGTTIAYCRDGNECTTWVSHTSGSHSYQAVIAGPNGVNVQATSPTVTVTWR